MSKDRKKLPANSYRLLVFLFSAFFALAAEGQSVGVVLSGGGAKGLYHVGVLKALEENNIPVDYIAGTSMGAIVGGLYAVGVTPDEMVREFTDPQIKYWATGEIEPKYNFLYKQSEPNATMLSLRLDPSIKGSRASLSRSLVSSEQMDLAILEYFTAANAASGGDFDKLMIPFRCVASDVAYRQPVVLRGGDLGLSVRASMSYPLVFGPVKLDSLTLYDGGMFDNFPWKTMVDEFNPDIIIGSSCLFPDSTANSQESIIDQAISLAIAATDYYLPEEKGILIGRNLSSVSLLDFDRAAFAIQRGYEDAMAMMDSVKNLISRRTSEFDLKLRREEFDSRKPEFMLESYRFSGLDSAQTEYVRRLLKLESRNGERQPIISFEVFRNQYLRAISGGEFEGTFPAVEYNPETRMFSILLDLKPKPSFRMMFGGNISSSALTQAYVGIEYKQIKGASESYNFDGYFSPFYVGATASARYDFFLSIPVSVKLYGSYNYYNYFRSNFGFVSRGNSISYLKHGDLYAGVKISTPLTRSTLFSLYSNFAQNTFRYHQQPGYDDNTPLDRTLFTSINTMAAIESNSIPNAFSIKGTSQSLSYIFVKGEESFLSELEGDSQKGKSSHWYGVRFTRESYLPFRWSKWFSLGYLVDMAYTTHIYFYNDFATMATSPAFTPTPHSKVVYMQEFRAESFAAGGLIPSVSFFPNLYLKMGAYAFLPRPITMEDRENRAKPRFIFDSSLVYQSLIGPVSLSLSKYGISNNNWFLTFNLGHIIFNKKSLFY